jgi:Rrf2 family transcriptional regulator, cysteine metabolism repressor
MIKNVARGGLYMKLSTRTSYGTQLLLHLVLNYEERLISLNEIAKTEKISEKYLSKIIIPLKAANLVKSVRGAHGGYALAKAPEEITLKNIVEILDGKIEIIKNLVQSSTNEPTKTTNTTNYYWKDINKKIIEIFSAIKLSDLVKKYNE